MDRGQPSINVPGGSDFASATVVRNYPYPWQLSRIRNPESKEYGDPLYFGVEENYAQTRLKVAGYQKDFRDLITRDQAVGYLNQGQGYARGIEISLKHRAGDRFFAWANYGYSVSKREDRPGDPERLYSFDQPHVATLTASYMLTPTWEIGAKWQYRSGLPYTPVVGREIRRHPDTGRPRYSPFRRNDTARFRVTALDTPLVSKSLSIALRWGSS